MSEIFWQISKFNTLINEKRLQFISFLGLQPEMLLILLTLQVNFYHFIFIKTIQKWFSGVNKDMIVLLKHVVTFHWLKVLTVYSLVICSEDELLHQKRLIYRNQSFFLSEPTSEESSCLKKKSCQIKFTAFNSRSREIR